MHPRVERLPRPDPDHRRFLAAVRRQDPGRVPLVELAVHPVVVAGLLDEAAPPGDPPHVARQTVRLLHRLGYDVVKMSAPIPFQVARVTGAEGSEPGAGREWQDQHRGPIGSAEVCHAYPWPTVGDVDFAPLDVAAHALPDGMRLVGFSGGVLEFALDLIGLERFMFAVYDAPDLIASVIDRVGQVIYGVFETYCQMDAVCAIWLGDDLGSKNGLLISPDILEAHVFPWYARFVKLAHQHDRPFLLHSCGRTESVISTLIEEVGIDAKHSFEDTIEPVETFADRWGARLGVLGGVDVNLLASGTPEAVTERTESILEHMHPTGGYVCGSGNSIPDYIPPENYLTMIEAVTRFNGRL